MNEEVVDFKCACEPATKSSIMANKRTKYRFASLALLTAVITVSTADRATLSVAGIGMGKDLGIDAVGMGYLFSVFAWAYMLGQVPAGWLGDKFGSKPVILTGIILWSMTTLAMGFIWPSSFAFMILLALRFLLGLFETPVGPSAGRIIAGWFPCSERGIAGAVFNSAQYLSIAIFTPLMGYLAFAHSWHYVYIVMGGLGAVLAVLWYVFFQVPTKHPNVNKAELDYITEGGGLIELDANIGNNDKKTKTHFKINDIAQLFKSRMLVGIFFGQYCISTITYFYMTWFPTYLVQAKGFTILKAGIIASVPAIAGCVGGISSGFVSDWILKKTGNLSLARKLPITIGLVLSSVIVICNYVEAESMVVFLMSAAFFGKGFGSLGWAVIADTAPKEIIGITGAVFNSSAQLAGVISPVVIGYIIHTTGSFNGALLFVGAHAFAAIFSYWFIVGKIQRFELKL